MKTKKTPKEEKGVTVLVFDGGGIRGLSSLLILRNIMYRIQQSKGLDSMLPPCEVFSLMAGTSTGGLIALMLGRLRMSVNDAIVAYMNLAEQVFSQVKRSGDGKFKATNLEKAMKAIVKSKTGDEETLLMDNGTDICHTFVCAMNSMNMDARIPQLFRTYSSPQEEEFELCKIWQAARATSAAPTFFKPVQIGMQTFIDGGMAHNNPTILALQEVKLVFPGRRVACILSLGAGKGDTISIPKSPSYFQRLLPVEVIKAIQSIAIDCEHVHEEAARRFENVPNIYFRFNLERDLQNIKLSQWEKLDIVEASTRQYLKLQDVAFRLPKLVEVLKNRTGQVLTDDIAGVISSPQPRSTSSSYKRCPPPTTIFTGRRDIINRMHDCFSSHGKRIVFLLYGLGGSGKSQIAYKFVSESDDRQRFSEVFFLDATTENTLRTSFEVIAQAKHLSEKMEDVLHWLQSNSNEWLLFYNNADDKNLPLHRFIPQCMHGNVIITSRNQGLCALAPGTNQKVSRMSQSDARDLLLYALDDGDIETIEKQTYADEITLELGYLPLAIVHARAYIQMCCPLHKFLVHYRNSRTAFLQAHQEQSADDYEHTVFTTWEMSVARLGSPATIFLQIISFMHHEQLAEDIFVNASGRIDPSIHSNIASDFLQGFKGKDEKWDFFLFRKQVIEDLLSFSLIEHDRVNDIFSIHPLVQTWSRAQIKEKRHIRQAAQTILALATGSEFKVDDYVLQRTILPHIQQALMDGAEVDDTLMSALAAILGKHGQWKEAEKLYKLATEARKEIYGEEHPMVLASMASLATMLWRQGRAKEAEQLDVMVMDARKRVLGNEHEDTLKSMGNLASTFRDQGRWKEAEQLEVEVMETRKRVLGEDHPSVLASMANLASTFSEQGRWKEAEELEVVVMETRKRVLGEDHPLTLTTMGNLASTFGYQGRWKEAEDLQMVVIEIMKRIFGNEHPDTLTSMANLASTLWDQGRRKEAEDLQIEVMETMKRTLGEEHPRTLTTMGNLASMFRDKGRWNEAVQLQRMVLDTRKRVLGDKHPDTIKSKAKLAIMFLKRDK